MKRWIAIAFVAASYLSALSASAGLFDDWFPRRRSAPSVGSRAPDFELRKVASEETIRLHAITADRPVALVFGSYT